MKVSRANPMSARLCVRQEEAAAGAAAAAPLGTLWYTAFNVHCSTLLTTMHNAELAWLCAAAC